MIKVIQSLSVRPLLSPMHTKLFQNMSMITDRLQDKQNKKQQEDFRKQIEYMANKPTFTYMDYKQRISDELNKIQSSIRGKMAQGSQETEKELLNQKKVLNALFEDELVSQEPLNQFMKKQISMITEMPIEFVRDTLKKAESYKKMHKMLRDKVESGEPLPESAHQLQYEFKNSRHYATQRDKRQAQRRQDSKGEGYTRSQRIKYMKFNK